MIEVNLDKARYQFDRNEMTGECAWICVQGSVPGMLGSNNGNMKVPLILSNTLTQIAIDSGCDKKLLSRKKNPVKEKTERRPRVKKPKITSGISLDF